MTDIVERLGETCVGHPNARIPWPRRILHEARAEITTLRQRAEAAEKRVAELEARANDNPCLRSLVEGKLCNPDAENLRRCTICGFVVDVAYEAEKPSIDFAMAGRGSSGNAALLARVAELEAALVPLGAINR